MAYIGAVLIVGLTACGAPTESPTGQAGSTPSGAPPVIQVDGAAPGAGAVPAAEDAAMSAADSKMMPAMITYVYDGEMTDMTAPAPSWFFAPDAQPSTEQIAALAAALGIDGEVRELGADAGGGWMVGPDNYEQPTVNVSTDAMHSWWYSAGNVSTAGSRGCELYPPGDPAADLGAPVANDAGAAGDVAVAPPDASTETVAEMPVCVEATPPANVPDQASAQAMARTLLETLGVDPDSFEYETYADDWSANVTGYLVLDGMRTSTSVNVGYGAEGAVTWASGFLATPQRGADYPRIGIEDAVQRLNDQNWGWMASSGGARDLGVSVGGGSSGSTGQGVATAEATEAAQPPQPVPADGTAPAPADAPVPAVEPAVSLEPMAVPLVDPAEGGCTDGAATDCAPISPIDVEPITVTFTAVHPSLEQLWASDGTVWLLPAYAFDAVDGGMYSVLAVEDQYIEVSQATEVPVPDTAPLVAPGVDPASPSECPARPTAITEPGLSADGIAGTIVGLCEADASALVAEIYPSASMRVVRIDGVDQAVTADFSDSRVNVAVDKGIVTEVISIG
jgi:hypothetical protein